VWDALQVVWSSAHPMVVYPPRFYFALGVGASNPKRCVTKIPMIKPPSRSKSVEPQLVKIPLAWEPESEIPAAVTELLQRADILLQKYWDSWSRRPIEQYVACDFRDVWRAMHAIQSEALAPGRLFCEWGCGFGIVTALASLLGWEAVGIEAEPFLTEEARRFLAIEKVHAEIWTGNFLPPGAERLAKQQANHASLFHQIPSAYANHDLEIDDFAIVFAYPWPGEDTFLKNVFRHYAADQALLLLFLGPYEIELYRKLDV
jgi:SAM-dependent methyltransferase